MKKHWTNDKMFAKSLQNQRGVKGEMENKTESSNSGVLYKVKGKKKTLL